MDAHTKAYLRWTSIATIIMTLLGYGVGSLIAFAYPGGWAAWRIGVMGAIIMFFSSIASTLIGLSKGEQYK